MAVRRRWPRTSMGIAGVVSAGELSAGGDGRRGGEIGQVRAAAGGSSVGQGRGYSARRCPPVSHCQLLVAECRRATRRHRRHVEVSRGAAA